MKHAQPSLEKQNSIPETENSYRDGKKLIVLLEKVDAFAEGLSTSPQLAFYLGFSPFNWRSICTVIVLLLIF